MAGLEIADRFFSSNESASMFFIVIGASMLYIGERKKVRYKFAFTTIGGIFIGIGVSTFADQYMRRVRKREQKKKKSGTEEVGDVDKPDMRIGYHYSPIR